MNDLIHFTKMQGLGNDFVVIDGIKQKIAIAQLPITQLAHRHLGIGFDQLLLIEPSTTADFFCRIFNGDGSEAEQCGNGLRSVARFVHEQGLHAQRSLVIATKAGQYEANIDTYEKIRVTMGIPYFEPEQIPFLAQKQQNIYEIQLAENKSLSASVVGLGNPHVIIRVDSLPATPIHRWGTALSTHKLFPKGVNVGFIEIIDRAHIILRTIERGAGETHACGSNASAAVVTGIRNGWLDPKVQVDFRYGSLWIEWQGLGSPVIMTGPASKVFSGTFDCREF